MSLPDSGPGDVSHVATINSALLRDSTSKQAGIITGSLQVRLQPAATYQRELRELGGRDGPRRTCASPNTAAQLVTLPRSPACRFSKTMHPQAQLGEAHVLKKKKKQGSQEGRAWGWTLGCPPQHPFPKPEPGRRWEPPYPQSSLRSLVLSPDPFPVPVSLSGESFSCSRRSRSLARDRALASRSQYPALNMISYRSRVLRKGQVQASELPL
ncbi:hypothetical protein SKAU_G00229610 [Synaphobranchus kaupii]|uniref:Uncharacterized protein n=1 Tax=Synaphobranchus kaupii TaxID=118154 RepID=A0A9Q1F5H8_SYNKA|nr:hypothetical protein SKAU_G00229610 [Synaphobranchus kaupii]